MRGFFWETTSGGIPYSALIGLTVDTWYCQSTEASVRISFFYVVYLDPEFGSRPALRLFCVCREEYRKLDFFGAHGSWMPWAGFAGVDALRAMFPSLFSGPDALHHGRYGPEGHFCGSAVAVCLSCHPCLYAEAVSHGPACLADHGDFAVAVRSGWSMSLVCSRAGSSSAAAVHQRGRLHPCRCAEFYPMVQTVRQTWDSPVASHGGRRPCSEGRAGSLPCRGAEGSFHGPDCSSDHSLPQLLNTVADVPVVPFIAGRHLPCRDAEVDPHGLVDHGDSAFAGGHGDRRPCCAGGASSTGAVVEMTGELTQLRAARELRWGFFRGPVHRYRAGGRVHRDTAPIIRCRTVVAYRQRHVIYIASWTTTTTDGISVLMVLSSRPLESCHHQCLKAVCEVLGYPEGSASELLDGTLKLH